MLSKLLMLSWAFGEEFQHPIPPQWQIPPASIVFSLPHGPEKPPPDDGYEFKSGSKGSGLAKIGMLLVVASGVTGVRALRAPAGSDLRQQRVYTFAGIATTGTSLILIARFR